VEAFNTTAPGDLTVIVTFEPSSGAGETFPLTVIGSVPV
jgi:hypothetical protein